jgi:hypothetical protein
MGEELRTLERLTHDAITAVVMRHVMALRIPKYYEPALSKEIADKLCASQLFGRYKNAPNIGRVGQAYFEGLSSKESAENYRKQSRTWLEQLRAECSPYILPVDRFRLELDEAWHRGARLGNLHFDNDESDKNVKAFAGLVRVFNEGSGTEIHADELEKDLDAIDQGRTDVLSQLAMNVYLDLPASGGEVKLWKIRLTKKEYEKYQIKGSYGLDPKKLPPPDFSFSPQTGDLWLFRANELHQVVEAGAGRRVTQSCFVGFQGEDRSLIIWS